MGNARIAAIRLVTVDVYTALVDLGASLLPPLREVLDDEEPAPALLRAWRAKQLELALVSNSLGGPRIGFRELTATALDVCCAALGLDPEPRARRRLVAAWDELVLWPEANEALAEVTRHRPLALLSNGDDTMLRDFAERHSLPCRHVFSAERAGVYKPVRAVYELPQRELDLRGEEILHVAGSATDTMGARAAGLRCVWSNRDGQVVPLAHVGPDFEVRDLRGLGSLLET